MFTKTEHTLMLKQPNPVLCSSGGYVLGELQSRFTWVPNGWQGRVWGRTHCNANRCETGDCGRGVHCNGAGGATPATLAEIKFDGSSGGKQDFYDISLVDRCVHV